MQQEQALDVKIECLDTLTDLLRRFGRELDGQYPAMVSTGLTHLQQGKVMVRKRANAFVGALAAVVPDAMLDAMMEELLKEIQGAEGRGPREVQNLIQTVGTVARTVGHRVGKHLCLVVPLLLRFLGGSGEKVGEEEEEEEQDDEKNELRETIFAALESVVLQCPREVTVHLPLIIAAALKFMKWDPNYTIGRAHV